MPPGSEVAIVNVDLNDLARILEVAGIERVGPPGTEIDGWRSLNAQAALAVLGFVFGPAVGEQLATAIDGGRRPLVTRLCVPSIGDLPRVQVFNL